MKEKSRVARTTNAIHLSPHQYTGHKIKLWGGHKSCTKYPDNNIIAVKNLQKLINFFDCQPYGKLDKDKLNSVYKLFFVIYVQGSNNKSNGSGSYNRGDACKLRIWVAVYLSVQDIIEVINQPASLIIKWFPCLLGI